MRSDAGTGKGATFAAAAVTFASDECLLWPYAKREGYGCFRRNNADLAAHVDVCEQAHGPKPAPQYEVAHTCGNRACVNPRHLRWDTRKGNHADKVGHGRHVRGTRNHKAKLTDADVVSIRASADSHAVAALRYGVCKATVAHIRSHRNWAWL